MLVPDAAAFIPETTSFGEPPVDVTALYVPTAAYVVTALDQEMRIRPRDGKLIPTVAVSFTVPGLPGTFTIRIDNYAFEHADPIQYMYERSYLIRGLYAIPDTLPPFDYGAQIGTKPIVTLDSAAATGPTDARAIQWAGTVNPRGPAAVAHLEATLLGEFDPFLVSADIQVPASDVAEPFTGTLGPLDPGRYTVVFSADNRAGIGTSPARAVTL